MIFCFFCFQLNLLGQKNSTFKTHHILVIDKTASMVGRGSGNVTNIWGDVQRAVIDYVAAVPFGDKITIYTFAEDLNNPVQYSINNEVDKNSAINFVKNINPNGEYTGIYRALDGVFKTLEKKETNFGRIIYLFTDGENNVDSNTMNDVINTFNAYKGEFDHCYYVQLRNNLSIPADVIIAAEQNSGFDTKQVVNLTDFKSPVVIKPKFLKFSKNFKDFQQYFDIEQRYTIFPQTDNIILTAEINYDETKCNLDLLNADNIEIIANDNNASILHFEFVNSDLNLNNGENFPITVKLKVVDSHDRIITIQPNSFQIILTSNAGKVEVQGSGWESD